MINERKVANTPTVRTKTRELDVGLGPRIPCGMSCLGAGRSGRDRRAGPGLDGLQCELTAEAVLRTQKREMRDCWFLFFFHSSRGDQCSCRVGETVRIVRILYVFMSLLSSCGLSSGLWLWWAPQSFLGVPLLSVRPRGEAALLSRMPNTCRALAKYRAQLLALYGDGSFNLHLVLLLSLFYR